jgi:hypothetical protein
MRKHYYSKSKNETSTPDLGVGDRVDTLFPDLGVGDRVEVLMHSRAKGYSDTGGGWTSDWVPATAMAFNRVTIEVRLDEYYFGYNHRMPCDRIRRIQNG